MRGHMRGDMRGCRTVNGHRRGSGRVTGRMRVTGGSHEGLQDGEGSQKGNTEGVTGGMRAHLHSDDARVLCGLLEQLAARGLGDGAPLVGELEDEERHRVLDREGCTHGEGTGGVKIGRAHV